MTEASNIEGDDGEPDPMRHGEILNGLSGESVFNVDVERTRMLEM
jgi:hypothetical protein